jgi:hypothetical protein
MLTSIIATIITRIARRRRCAPENAELIETAIFRSSSPLTRRVSGLFTVVKEVTI